MNTQNLIQTNKSYRRWAQRAFFVYAGYAIALLFLAVVVDELWILSLPTLVIFIGLFFYANKQYNTLDFPRALGRPVLVWSLTVMIVVMLYGASPWMDESLAFPLRGALFFVSLFFGTAAAVLAVQYDQQFPPTGPTLGLPQYLYVWAALIFPLLYLAVYATMWLGELDGERVLLASLLLPVVSLIILGAIALYHRSRPIPFRWGFAIAICCLVFFAVNVYLGIKVTFPTLAATRATVWTTFASFAGVVASALWRSSWSSKSKN